MTTIRADRDCCTVIITLTCKAPAILGEVQVLAERMMPIFAKQAGFISMAAHRSTDDTQLVIYLQWQDRASHDACQKSNDFGDLGPQLLGHLASGQAKLDLKIHDVIGVVSAD